MKQLSTDQVLEPSNDPRATTPNTLERTWKEEAKCVTKYIFLTNVLLALCVFISYLSFNKLFNSNLILTLSALLTITVSMAILARRSRIWVNSVFSVIGWFFGVMILALTSPDTLFSEEAVVEDSVVTTQVDQDSVFKHSDGYLYYKFTDDQYLSEFDPIQLSYGSDIEDGINNGSLRTVYDLYLWLQSGSPNVTSSTSSELQSLITFFLRYENACVRNNVMVTYAEYFMIYDISAHACRLSSHTERSMQESLLRHMK